MSVDPATPSVTFTHEGERHTLECDVIAGLRRLPRRLPAGDRRRADRLRARVPVRLDGDPGRVRAELRGADLRPPRARVRARLAALARRSRACTSSASRTRSPWSDEAIWDELDRRFGMEVNRGPIFEKGVTPMRSFVVEPMQHERLFLAGDAAHIVPPTGAKGLNTAMADVYLLANAIGDDGESSPRTRSARSKRVWRVQHFSWWMTSMLHRFAGDDDFQMRLQHSQLRYTTTSARAGHGAGRELRRLALRRRRARPGNCDGGHRRAARRSATSSRR